MTHPRMPLKRACVANGQYGLNVRASDYAGSGVRFIRTSDLATGSLAEGGIFVPESAVSADDRLEENDLLLSRAGTIGRAFLTPRQATGFAFAGFLVRFRPRSTTEPRFLFYCTQSAEFQSQVQADAVSSTIQNFNADKYGNVSIPLPHLREQSAIADYLDRETVQIDALIEKQQRLIELARERLGVRLDLALRADESRTVSLGRHVDIVAGNAFASDEFVAEGTGPRLLRGVNVKPGRISWEDSVRWDRESSEATSRFSLAEGDIVLGMDRPLVGGGIRVATVLGEDLPALLVQRVMRLRALAGLDQGYLELLLRSNRFISYLEPMFTGVSIPHMSEAQVRAFPAILPDVDMQRSIAREMALAAHATQNLIARTEEAIELSRERRAALITAAVTGQIEVPGAA